MRVCRQISTGRILEMQSHATAGTLIANAAVAFPGIPEVDLEELVVTRAEYFAMAAAAPKDQAQMRIETDASEEASVKNDNQVMQFLDMTPAQLDTWVANNIEAAGLTLAQVKTNTGTALRVLGRIALAAGRGRSLR